MSDNLIIWVVMELDGRFFVFQFQLSSTVEVIASVSFLSERLLLVFRCQLSTGETIALVLFCWTKFLCFIVSYQQERL